MIAIYVTKAWLEMIGEVKPLLIVREESQDFASLLAGKAHIDGQFVDCELARSEFDADENVFLPAKIPVNQIAGIFDLTAKQAHKYGFLGDKG